MLNNTFFKFRTEVIVIHQKLNYGHIFIYSTYKLQ
jgi:hypothetical protein